MRVHFRSLPYISYVCPTMRRSPRYWMLGLALCGLSLSACSEDPASPLAACVNADPALQVDGSGGPFVVDGDRLELSPNQDVMLQLVLRAPTAACARPVGVRWETSGFVTLEIAPTDPTAAILRTVGFTGEVRVTAEGGISVTVSVRVIDPA
jgi:hypothetical protein